MSSRTQRTALVMLAAVLTACTATPTSTSLLGPNAPYFIDNKPVTVEREYLRRYACADGVLLDCRCSGRLGRCECSC